MMFEQVVVVSVFTLVFLAIITEKLDKTLVALFGALFLISTGFIEFEEAVDAVDFNTICLLMGMMLIVETLSEVQIFRWSALKLGLLTKGNPVLIFFLFGLSTAVFSAFLDNVTTVLIIVPLVITLTEGIGLPATPFVMTVIFLSNIGGTATMIGDPPNIIIGSQVEHLTFMSFIQYLTLPVVVSSLLVMLYILYKNRSTIKSRNSSFSWLFMSNLMLEDMYCELEELKIPRSHAVKSLSIFGLVLLFFFSHNITHLEPSVVALSGAVLMLIAFHKELNLHHLIAKVEWPTLLFFAGLFVIVGALEHAGVLKIVSHSLVSITDNFLLLVLIVLWASAMFSAVVDNIPFVAVMIPVLKDLLSSGAFSHEPKSQLIWWALALGACFGGNGTLIGASANVVSVAIAKTKGLTITFKDFLKDSIPATVITLLVSTAYIVFLYYL
ncbi:MAG: hypothetical protein D6719_02985 [Candidatus Dadabacteria bacterium]|nr:MAG: hypothetical protein D6719_02985 [Candidatus Dadabacteria bacterium]